MEIRSRRHNQQGARDSQRIAFFNTLFSHLYALDAKSGRLIWDVKTEGKAYSKTIVAGDIVYFGSGDHNLYAVSALSGKILWRFQADDAVNYRVVMMEWCFLEAVEAYTH